MKAVGKREKGRKFTYGIFNIKIVFPLTEIEFVYARIYNFYKLSCDIYPVNSISGSRNFTSVIRHQANPAAF